MPSISDVWRASALAALTTVLSTFAIAAPALTTLHTFAGGTRDGAAPFAGLIFDKAQTTLYGTTQFGGTAKSGTVFQTDIATGATSVLHSFTNLQEGFFPQAGLAMDTAGALYGTTISVPTAGGGAVFKLDPTSGVFTVLHSFLGGSDGFFPEAPVTLDSAGNVYGTTLNGGVPCALSPLNCGTVFRIDHASGALSILYAFTGGGDGAEPFSGVVFGPGGMLYGETFQAGSNSCGVGGCGTVFKLDPATGQLTTLHAFTMGNDGAFPLGNVTFDKTGILYATTEGGGPHGAGTIYKLDPATNALTVLHAFSILDHNGGFPVGGLTFDRTGKFLYGTNFFGGNGGHGTCKSGGGAGCGTVFKFDPASGKFDVLYHFAGGADGGNPAGAILLDRHGVMYSTTELDGANKKGTVFALGGK